jgi:microcystin-dependent protein
MEKYLIILSIIIIVFYCLYCNQKDNKETFTSLVGCNTDVTSLATLARNLQSTSEEAMINTHLNLKNKHLLSSDSDGLLRLKSYSNLTQNADMAVRNLNVIGNFNLLPRGIIVAWNNSDVPAGWAICDGTRTTPDLRGRFILGQGQGSNLTNRSLGDISGQENVTLNLNQIPAHAHTYSIPVSGTTVGDERPRVDVYSTSTVTFTAPIGGGLPFDNMPPYYVLTYIMKL